MVRLTKLINKNAMSLHIGDPENPLVLSITLNYWRTIQITKEFNSTLGNGKQLSKFYHFCLKKDKKLKEIEILKFTAI